MTANIQTAEAAELPADRDPAPVDTLLAEIERLRSALEGCAGDGCWAVTVPDCLTEFPMDPAEWCPACIAIAALTEGGES